MIRAFFTTPLRIIEFAVVRAYIPLVQAVLRSIQAALLAPNNFCTFEAALGTNSSKVQLPKTINSTSSAVLPAAASACAQATWANSLTLTCEMRRSFIPVRVVIHSSSVSRKVARSSFVKTAGGRHLPQPVMFAYVIKILGYMAVDSIRQYTLRQSDCQLQDLIKP